MRRRAPARPAAALLLLLSLPLLRRCDGLRWDAACLSSCPSTFAGYPELHARLRRDPAAPRVTAVCEPGPANHDAGLGDRFRGALFALRFAAHHGRLFVLDMPQLQLAGRLRPAAVDWSVAGLPRGQGLSRATVTYARLTEAHFSSPELDHQVTLDLAAAVQQGVGDIRVCSTTVVEEVMDGAPNTPGLIWARSRECIACLFSMLFAETEEMAHRTAQKLGKLFGQEAPWAGVPFVAVHIRLGGGLRGEEQRTPDQAADPHHRGTAFVAQHAAQYCAARLGANLSVGRTPAVFVTDNRLLRDAIRAGHLAGVVGPAAPVAHFAKGAPSDEHVWEMYTDIALLARASCLVVSRSGFSNLALWWGAHDCVRTLNDCVGDMEDVYGAKMVGFEMTGR